MKRLSALFLVMLLFVSLTSCISNNTITYGNTTLTIPNNFDAAREGAKNSFYYKNCHIEIIDITEYNTSTINKFMVSYEKTNAKYNMQPFGKPKSSYSGEIEYLMQVFQYDPNPSISTSDEDKSKKFVAFVRKKRNLLLITITGVGVDFDTAVKSAEKMVKTAK